MKKKKICIITSCRAEYGILKKLIIRLKQSKRFITNLLVTGTHLSPKYGNTFRNIENDGVGIDYKIKIDFKKTDKFSIVKDMSKYLNKFSDAFKKINPSLIIILGDRYEILCAAISANIIRIPIAHIHGGETTFGSYDDNMRHAITKLSNLHFVSTDKYKTRVIQMGENPRSVFNVGSLGVENLIDTKKNSKFSKKIFNFNLKKKKILITYHSLTTNIKKGRKDFDFLLNSLKKLKDTSIIFSYPSHDVDSDYIINKIKKFVKKNRNSICVKSLGQENYYQCLKNFDCMIGNSSSGIIEAPSARIPTINIGNRQEGRVMSKSISNINVKKVLSALKKIYELKKTNKIDFFNPYYKSYTSQKIIKNLNKVNFNKNFFDLRKT